MIKLIKIIQSIKLRKVLMKVQLHCFTTIVKFTIISFLDWNKNVNALTNATTFRSLELSNNFTSFNKKIYINNIQEQNNKSAYLLVLFAKISEVIDCQEILKSAGEIEFFFTKKAEWFFGVDFENIFQQTNNYEYFKIFTMFCFILLISFVLFGVAYFLSLSTIKDSEKLSQYECGFEPFDEATRHPFDVHFYVVGILFLIFDVEIALLFPWVLRFKTYNWFGFFTMFLFLFILTIGFFYEWHRGALVWPHKNLIE